MKSVVHELGIRLAIALVRIWERPHWWAEFWSAMVAILWSRLDHVSPDNITTVSRYHVLLSIFSKPVLDKAFLILGLVQLCSLMADVALSTDLRWWRFGASALLGVLYCIVALSFVLADGGWPAPAAAWVIGYVGMNIFATIKASAGGAT